jgi:NADPH:quinone reductase-like Zn-dependent oxidoreductase
MVRTFGTSADSLRIVFPISHGSTVRISARSNETFTEGVVRLTLGNEAMLCEQLSATHMVADADLLAPRTGNLSPRAAAAIPLVFITAWEGLIDRARLRAGQKVLIHAGAGGVGNAAVQIAHAFTAQVFATASAAKMKIVQAYGAVPINYQAQSVDEYLAEHTGSEGFDVVYDTVGGSTLDDSFLAAKTYTGHVVSCLGWGHSQASAAVFSRGHVLRRLCALAHVDR